MLYLIIGIYILSSIKPRVMSNPYEFVSNGDYYNPKSNQFKDRGIIITGTPTSDIHIRSFPQPRETQIVRPRQQQLKRSSTRQ